MDTVKMPPGPDFSRGRALFCGHKIRPRGKWEMDKVSPISELSHEQIPKLGNFFISYVSFLNKKLLAVDFRILFGFSIEGKH